MNRDRLHGLIDLVLDMRESLVPHAPKEALAHFRNAKRESLLGVKVLVEHALAKVEEEEQKATATAAADGSRTIPLE